MKTTHFIRLLCICGLLLTVQASAQRQITWQAANASGAERVNVGLQYQYTSMGQPMVGVSTGSGRVLSSGYLFVRLMPSGAANIVAQSSLDFGSVIVGQSTTRSLTVQNTGSQPLNITGTTIAPAGYTISSGGGPQTTNAGGSITIQMQFQPSAAGGLPGTLTIASNAANAPSFVVSLVGTGVATAPNLQLSSTALDFGAVSLGSSGIRSVTLNNTGNATLSITGQTISGANATDFSVSHPSAASIAATGNDYIELRFAPTVIGSKSATLTITSNDPNHPTQTVSLTGTGSSSAQPHISLSVTSVDFGTTSVGNQVNRSVIITNTGTAALSQTTQTVSGTYFSLQSAGAATVPVGNNTIAQLVFQPGAVGTFTGSFDIASNDPTTPTVSVSLHGVCSSVTGPRITVSRTVVDFGQVPLLTAKEEDVVIRNTGTSDLAISGQSITGSDALHFSISQAAASPIGSGGQSTVRVRHLPMTLGSKVAYLRILSNDPGQPTTDVALISTVVGVDKLDKAPSGIVLHQNYPNPVSSGQSTIMDYEVDSPGKVELAVFNTAGQQVAVLDNAFRAAGTYRATFETLDLPTGVYSAQLMVSHPSGTRTSNRVWLTIVR